MSAITTHILDTSRGKPAAGVRVTLEVDHAGAWSRVGEGVTDADGRLRTLLADGIRPAVATYRLTFEVVDYFAQQKLAAFFPTVQISFAVTAPNEHHHVPLLLSPFGYSTYRGS